MQRFSTVKDLEEKFWPADGLLKRVPWRVKEALFWESEYDTLIRRHKELSNILTRIVETPALVGLQEVRELMDMDELDDLVEYRRNRPRNFMRGTKEHTYFAKKTREEIAATKAEDAEIIACQKKEVVKAITEMWEQSTPSSVSQS
jgi:hypothetical protein